MTTVERQETGFEGDAERPGGGPPDSGAAASGIRAPRLIVYLMATFVPVAFAWAWVGTLDIIAKASGRLVPANRIKIVQPLDGGVVREILVREGDAVQRGQLLIRMDSETAEADTKRLRHDLTLTRLQLALLDAERIGRAFERPAEADPALFEVANAQIASRREAHRASLAQERQALLRGQAELLAAKETLHKLERLLPIFREQEGALGTLHEKGYIGKLKYLDAQRGRIEAEREREAQRHVISALAARVHEGEERIASLEASYRSQSEEQRVQLVKEAARLEGELKKQEYRNVHVELRSPRDGVVKDLATHTEGSVVAPGTVLLTVVPEGEELVAEVYVENRDIGFVRSGQRARVKVASYDFQRYGALEATVERVGPDSTERPAEPGNAGAPAAGEFKAQLRLASQYVGREGQRFALGPGMQVAAEIRTGDRTVLEYLLSPLRRTLDESGGER